MKNLLLIAVILFTTYTFSQQVCESKEDTIEDLNSITKCTVETKKKSKTASRQISVKVSASKNRFLKKRAEIKKSVASSANNLNSSGISETKHAAEISNSLSFNDVAKLTNTLTAEEVKKALKFSFVDQIPLFEGCKGTKGEASKSCFNEEMIKHIQKHFKYPHDALVNKIQGEVWVRFIIDNDGNVTNIKTLGPQGAKILDREATRVVSKLPKFIPGKKDGESTSVKYGFPITFSLEE